MSSPVARHGIKKQASVIGAVMKLIAVTLAVVLVSGASVAAIAAWNVSKDIQTVSLAGDDGEPEGPPPQISAIEGGVNLLLVGSDSRENQGDLYGDESTNLNDVTMLLHISEDHTSATVVSFPRDLVVPIPSCPDGEGGFTEEMSAQPINVTLFYGGLACTVLTVEALTGLDIPFAAEIQFNGVIEMSNAVGGVPVCVASPIEDEFTQTYLEAGTHTLQGQQALQFLRSRHGVGDGSDLGRISSQQVFLSSLVRTIKSSETLTDMSKLYGLARAATSNMILSDSLASLDTMVSIAVALKDIPLESIGFYAYPGATGGDGVYSGKVEPLTEDAEVMFAAIREDRPITSAAGNTGIGAVTDPNAPAPDPAAPAPSEPVDPAAPVDPNAPVDPSATTPPTDGSSVLPETIKGQTAAEFTCSKGFGEE